MVHCAVVVLQGMLISKFASFKLYIMLFCSFSTLVLLFFTFPLLLPPLSIIHLTFTTSSTLTNGHNFFCQIISF